MTAPALIGQPMAAAADLHKVIPTPLRPLKRWTAWEARPKTLEDGTPKVDKKPASRTDDPTTWRTLDEALEDAPPPERGGIGLILTRRPGVEDAGVWAGDVDKCRDPKTGALTPTGQAIFDAAAGLYVEVSPSGRGLRILGSGGVPTDLAEFLNRTAGVEFYAGASSRYVTITGAVLNGAGILAPMPAALAQILAQHSTARGGEDKPGVIPSAVAVMTEAARVSMMNQAGLTDDQRSFVVDGGPPGDRSEKVWGIFRALSEAGVSPSEIYRFAVSSPGVWKAALSKRSFQDKKARQHLWTEAHRAARNEREADAAPATASPTVESPATGKEDGYEYGGRAKHREAKKIASNVAEFIRKEWPHRVRYNERHGRIEVDGEPFQLQGQVRNDLVRSMCRRLDWDSEPSLEILTQGLIEAAEADTYDPVLEYLDRLAWDGVDRFPGLVTALGAGASPLSLAMMKKTLIAGVARARRPGCKVDTVPILVGRQGLRKSMFWRAMGAAPEGSPDPSAPSDCFSDSPITFGGDKDSAMKTGAPWIQEVPEYSSTKTANRDQVKQELSLQEDKYRPPYAREMINRPRRGIRVGSTNEAQFLNDPTGARRFWPVEVEEIDIPWVMQHRDQLWAQADALFEKKAPWWFDRGDEHADELADRHEAAYDADGIEALLDERLTPDLLQNWKATGAVLIGEVALAVGIDLARASRNISNRIGDALRRQGFQRTQVRRGDKRVKAWKHRSWDLVPALPPEVDPLS
jgi:hypothetical protein